MSSLIRDVQIALQKEVDSVYKAGAENFFNEDICIYGVRIGTVRKIAKQYGKRLKDASKKEVFEQCEALLASGYHEDAIVAFAWAYAITDQYVPSDFLRFKRWIRDYVTNWALCDDLCTHAFGALILQEASLLPKLFAFSKSKNHWFRRAAAVTLIHAVKRKAYLEEAFKVADKLLLDEHPLVQKGYGWLLKEASNHYPVQVFQFVMQRKDRMPRTALRYAIEKYPKEMRKEAMKREK